MFRFFSTATQNRTIWKEDVVRLTFPKEPRSVKKNQEPCPRLWFLEEHERYRHRDNLLNNNRVYHVFRLIPDQSIFVVVMVTIEIWHGLGGMYLVFIKALHYTSTST